MRAFGEMLAECGKVITQRKVVVPDVLLCLG
jgi:hypothetical protein